MNWLQITMGARRHKMFLVCRVNQEVLRRRLGTTEVAKVNIPPHGSVRSSGFPKSIIEILKSVKSCLGHNVCYIATDVSSESSFWPARCLNWSSVTSQRSLSTIVNQSFSSSQRSLYRGMYIFCWLERSAYVNPENNSCKWMHRWTDVSTWESPGIIHVCFSEWNHDGSRVNLNVMLTSRRTWIFKRYFVFLVSSIWAASKSFDQWGRSISPQDLKLQGMLRYMDNDGPQPQDRFIFFISSLTSFSVWFVKIFQWFGF